MTRAVYSLGHGLCLLYDTGPHKQGLFGRLSVFGKVGWRQSTDNILPADIEMPSSDRWSRPNFPIRHFLDYRQIHRPQSDMRPPRKPILVRLHSAHVQRAESRPTITLNGKLGRNLSARWRQCRTVYFGPTLTQLVIVCGGCVFFGTWAVFSWGHVCVYFWT